MAIKNIVFDLGGVIIGLDRNEAVRRFIGLGVEDAEQLIDIYEQKGIFLEIENGKLDEESFRRQLSLHAGKEITTDEILYAWKGFVLDVPQYKLDYMEELRKDFKVYILSNTNPFILTRFALTDKFCDSGRPLSDYCDKIYASFEIGMTKPGTCIFEYMIKDSGMIPSEALFIDDGIRNIEAAASMGLQTYHPANREDWRKPLDSILQKAFRY